METEQPEQEHGEADYEEVEEYSSAPLSALLLDHPRPLPTVHQGFWTAGFKKIPFISYSPWDFYEPFLDIGVLTCLVTCNNRSTVRAVKVFSAASWGGSATYIPLLRILHQNFVEVYKVYFFEGQVFVITEHVGSSLEDLLQKDVCFSEPDIAYIISEVGRTLSIFTVSS